MSGSSVCEVAKVIEVIWVLALKGEGRDGDPIRHVDQYWTKDGKLLAERDRYLDKEAQDP